MNWLSLNPAKGILAGCPYVCFVTYSNFEGLIKNVCRAAGFPLLALFMVASPAPVTLCFVMLRVKNKDKDLKLK